MSSNQSIQTYKEILNEFEIDKIVAFCQDKITFEAVKKYVLFYLHQGIAKPGEPLKGNANYAFQLAWDRNGMPRTNEELGADLRALVRGVQVVESGFKELSEITIKAEETKKEDVNPAL